MTQRSMRLYGEVAGSAVSIQIDFGGAWAFQSVLTGADSLLTRDPGALISPEQEIMFAEFSFPMELTGWQPMSISCSGGEMVWTRSLCNYFGSILQMSRAISVRSDAVWPQGRPADDAEILNDSEVLTREQWRSKYGSGTRRTNLTYEILQPSETVWKDCGGPNTVESDGRRNVTINGESKSVDIGLRQQGLSGDWAWRIRNNQTLNCEIFIVDPQLG